MYNLSERLQTDKVPMKTDKNFEFQKGRFGGKGEGGGISSKSRMGRKEINHCTTLENTCTTLPQFVKSEFLRPGRCG